MCSDYLKSLAELQAIGFVWLSIQYKSGIANFSYLTSIHWAVTGVYTG